VQNNISKHITFNEATKSPTAIRNGIKNEPNAQELSNMKLVAEKCFEPLREWYGKPIKVNSFFRCEKLNTLVKGSKTSQHVEGKAIDMDAGSKQENKKIFEWCKANLVFDQIVNEYDFSWIHISYNASKNRNQILIVK
jgi:zinc D-Ala-D-Ala carboxypeptidase